jgi:hypothetical protein
MKKNIIKSSKRKYTPKTKTKSKRILRQKSITKKRSKRTLHQKSSEFNWEIIIIGSILAIQIVNTYITENKNEIIPYQNVQIL